MLRIMAGVVVGFIVWSILWTGSDAVFSALSPDWHGKHLAEFQAAIDNRIDYTADSAMLILALIKSVICSLAAGFVAASIARENVKSTAALGVLLLLFGIFVQSILWNYVPLWYHVPFLLLLIPVTIAGGKLKKNFP